MLHILFLGRPEGFILSNSLAIESKGDFSWRRISFQRINMNYLPSNRNLIRNADPEDIWVSEAAAAAQGVAERDVVRGRVALQPEA